MGLREKAQNFRRSHGQTDLVDHIEDYFLGKVLDEGDLRLLKEQMDTKLNQLTALLDRKLIDMQTLFEVGKEITSTLSTQDLLDIVSFTLMGQFRISDTAVFLFGKNGIMNLQARKGFEGLETLTVSESFTGFLKSHAESLTLTELISLKKEFTQFEEAEARLIVPMLFKSELTGFIVLGRKPDNEYYEPEEKAFISTLASLTAIALENARLYGELLLANENLEKKYQELSSLYEISRVINSADEQKTVLELIGETVMTGFGVKKGLLFTLEKGHAVIRKSFGILDLPEGVELDLPPVVEKQNWDNTASVIELEGALKERFRPYDRCLFVPLYAVKSRVGGMLIFSFENYDIDARDEGLLGLFSIIASQVAPPMLITDKLSRERGSELDPLSTITGAMEKAIEEAGEFGLSIRFCQLRLTQFARYIQFYGGVRAREALASLSRRMLAVLPPAGRMVQLYPGRYLFILPAVSDSDTDGFRDSILDLAREAFHDQTEIDPGPDFRCALYPEEAQDAFSILSLLE